MSNPKIEFTDEEKMELAYTVSQLALKTVHKRPIEKSSHTVTLEVPVELVQVLERLAERTGQGLDTLLSGLASRGLELSLQLDLSAVERAQQPTQPVQPQQQPVAGDPAGQLAQLTELMGTLGKFTETMQGLQSTVQNANSGTSPKNSK